METGEIGPVLPADIEEISRLHRAVLPDGFLAQLGESVLTRIYSAAFMAPGAIGLAAHAVSVAQTLLQSAMPKPKKRVQSSSHQDRLLDSECHRVADADPLSESVRLGPLLPSARAF